MKNTSSIIGSHVSDMVRNGVRRFVRSADPAMYMRDANAIMLFAFERTGTRVRANIVGYLRASSPKSS